MASDVACTVDAGCRNDILNAPTKLCVHVAKLFVESVYSIEKAFSGRLDVRSCFMACLKLVRERLRLQDVARRPNRQILYATGLHVWECSAKQKVTGQSQVKCAHQPSDTKARVGLKAFLCLAIHPTEEDQHATDFFTGLRTIVNHIATNWCPPTLGHRKPLLSSTQKGILKLCEASLEPLMKQVEAAKARRVAARTASDSSGACFPPASQHAAGESAAAVYSARPADVAVQRVYQIPVDRPSDPTVGLSIPQIVVPATGTSQPIKHRRCPTRIGKDEVATGKAEVTIGKVEAGTGMLHYTTQTSSAAEQKDEDHLVERASLVVYGVAGPLHHQAQGSEAGRVKGGSDGSTCLDARQVTVYTVSSIQPAALNPGGVQFVDHVGVEVEKAVSVVGRITVDITTTALTEVDSAQTKYADSSCDDNMSVNSWGCSTLSMVACCSDDMLVHPNLPHDPLFNPTLSELAALTDSLQSTSPFDSASCVHSTEGQIETDQPDNRSPWSPRLCALRGAGVAAVTQETQPSPRRCSKRLAQRHKECSVRPRPIPSGNCTVSV